MSTTSIAQQIDDFNTGFEAQIGDRLAGVFADEREALRNDGLPAGALGVDDDAPDAPLLTPDGATTSLSTALGGAVGVVVFYRGAWCPYCNIILRTYQQELAPALRDRGAQLIAVSPQTPEGSTAIADAADLDFAVLSDPANALAERFGIVTEPSAEARDAHTDLGFDVADSNADDTARVPFPSVYVIDTAGRIRFADIHVDYTTRTEAHEIIRAVDALD
ncbi:peroxiredoxin-like family protein [Microbacterium sp. NPDC090007]|uniref:peroxiredoxin-like family protein n=1 Tax=Microbacterium sp. NPDC090007 TaxID=3364204 RepID=UPI003813CA61